MGLKSQLGGGITEIHRFLSDESETVSVLGASFKPVTGRHAFEKTPGDAGFVAGFDATFVALNSDIAGLSLPQTIGAALRQGQSAFLVRRYEAGPLTTAFYCDAKNA